MQGMEEEGGKGGGRGKEEEGEERRRGEWGMYRQYRRDPLLGHDSQEHRVWSGNCEGGLPNYAGAYTGDYWKK